MSAIGRLLLAWLSARSRVGARSRSHSSVLGESRPNPIPQPVQFSKEVTASTGSRHGTACRARAMCGTSWRLTRWREMSAARYCGNSEASRPAGYVRLGSGMCPAICLAARARKSSPAEQAARIEPHWRGLISTEHRRSIGGNDEFSETKAMKAHRREDPGAQFDRFRHMDRPGADAWAERHRVHVDFLRNEPLPTRSLVE